MADREPGEGGRACVGHAGGLLWGYAGDGGGGVGNGASTLESLHEISERRNVA